MLVVGDSAALSGPVDERGHADSPGDTQFVEFVDGAHRDPVEVESDVVDGCEEFTGEARRPAFSFGRAGQGHGVHDEVAEFVGECHAPAVRRKGRVEVDEVGMVFVGPQRDGVEFEVAKIFDHDDDPGGFQQFDHVADRAGESPQSPQNSCDGDLTEFGGVVVGVQVGQRQCRVDVGAGRDSSEPHRDDVGSGHDAVALPFRRVCVGAEVDSLRGGSGERHAQCLRRAIHRLGVVEKGFSGQRQDSRFHPADVGCGNTGFLGQPRFRPAAGQAGQGHHDVIGL